MLAEVGEGRATREGVLTKAALLLKLASCSVLHCTGPLIKNTNNIIIYIVLNKNIKYKMLHIQEIIMSCTLESFDLFLSLTAVIVFGIYTYTYYNKILKTTYPTSNSLTVVSPNKNFKLLKYSLSSGGAVVPYGNANTNTNDNDDFTYNGPTTTVEVSDADLNELLQVVFAQIGDSNFISVELLQSYGFYTPTVVAYLESLGYIIN